LGIARESSNGNVCWLCGRPLGSRIEHHHAVPKSRGGRETVPIHPICHRTLQKTFSNSEPGLFGESVASIRADPRIGRFLAWIANKGSGLPRAHERQPLALGQRQFYGAFRN
jgi:hypothetical protein